jgi:hypothetical protein
LDRHNTKRGHDDDKASPEQSRRQQHHHHVKKKRAFSLNPVVELWQDAFGLCV